MSDDEDEGGDWDSDEEEEESCQHSTSTNASTSYQDYTNSCSTKTSRCHTSSNDHPPCEKMSSCEEKCEENSNNQDHCNGGRKKKNLCCCCYRKMFPDEENIFSSSSRPKTKSRRAATQDRLRQRLTEKKDAEEKAKKAAILERKIKVLSMEANRFKTKRADDIREEGKLFAEKQKLVDVDELLDFIEGNKNEDNNKRPMSNDKKKAKKERQKQQRMEEIRKLQEEEKRLKEQLEKETKRMEEEKRKKEEIERLRLEEEKRKQDEIEQQRFEMEKQKQEEKERLRIKKINKKAAQKAKKLAEKELYVLSSDPTILDNMDAINKSKVDKEDKACMTCYDDTLTPTETLEHIKEQHLNDFKQLQQFHRLLIDNVFAPKDIDLENREMDAVEREVEAFKRFCFNSVPVQEKPKVEIDMRKISLKKKEIYGDLIVAKKSFATWCCDM